jgi:uncharacterized protein YndB with AHSA1/START domain
MRIIRKEILIAAPVAKVWSHITDPAKIAGWLMENDFEARPDKEFRMDCGTEGPISCKVLEVVPEKKLVYSWAMDHLKVKTLVTITLEAEKNNQTRLVLVHSGWDALPPSGQDVAEPFDKGWDERLRILVELVASAS